jgi:Domain of unknown function (DUF4258)
VRNKLSEILPIVKHFVAQRRVPVSEHGLEELRGDGIKLTDILESAAHAELVEDYPEAFKGPTVLALHVIHGKPIHVVWGFANATIESVTLVTA